MKLCKDCLHALPDPLGRISDGSRCGNPAAYQGGNPITGGGEQRHCLPVRYDKHACGEDAKWFEARVEGSC